MEGRSANPQDQSVPQLKAADLGKAEHFQLRGHELLYEQRDIISCDACDSIAQHLRQAQKSGSEVKTLLEKGCNSLSGTQRSLCENFVQSYKKELSKLLQKSQEEKDICRELDLCVRKQTERLLGENECTWGPAQWCKDRKTADKCHAVDYCKKHRWKQG
ncbi:prosaposin-like isoform X2 [Hypanus sabinus]|uniref:prosaposin-like isoform X1 n=1 Tax=Hypanus sabinus TaxID=79690 RepID=UPI0028C4DC1F|nr:prosaposin-like isoform X1 [Hypanus sabinus]XP_059820237.1 prosaposin-like isoform X2 [Hypanus sabinus]